ncbi:MAG: hypothetical protein E6G66_16870 [Actinobacteria bacterium]|nr:MAG: hypothetical protein E6G66_16870 [Actinomycetota bacterium]
MAAGLVALLTLGSVLGVVGGHTAAHADNTCQVGSKVTTLQPISGSQRWALDVTATECFTNGVAHGWSFIFQSRSLPDDIQPGTFLGLYWVPCSCYLSTKQTRYAGGQTLSTPVVYDANRADYSVVSFSASGPGVVVPNSFFDQNA